MKKGVSIIINILLFAVIVFLAWQVVKSIQAPIKFNNELATRETPIKVSLVDIRNAEVFYKQAHNKYTADFDSLVNYCKTDSIPIVSMRPKIIVNESFDTIFSTSIDTLKFIKIADSIASLRKQFIQELEIQLEVKNLEAALGQFNIDEMKLVPGGDGKVFEIESGTIPRNGLDVPVFEVRTPYEVYMAKPNKSFSQEKWDERVRNLKDEKESIGKYAGVKIGSMEEAILDGNWETL